MARDIILHPERSEIIIWGVLAHVTEAERKRILNLPHGKTPKEIKRLEREVDLAKYPRKKKSNVTTSWYNPKVKPLTNKEQDHDNDAE